MFYLFYRLPSDWVRAKTASRSPQDLISTDERTRAKQNENQFLRVVVEIIENFDRPNIKMWKFPDFSFLPFWCDGGRSNSEEPPRY